MRNRFITIIKPNEVQFKSNNTKLGIQTSFRKSQSVDVIFNGNSSMKHLKMN